MAGVLFGAAAVILRDGGIADWFHAPESTEIDVEAWNGQVGQVIRIQAVDNVEVTQVNVVITDTEGV